MSAINEYIPDEAEAQALTQAQNQSQNPQQQPRKSYFWQTVFAARKVVLDRSLSHGAIRLYSLLTEFSFCKRSICDEWGIRALGDGEGGIEISIDELGRAIGANLRFVQRWKKQLLKNGYIWEDKIPSKTGWPHHKYFLTCIVPKTAQKELFPVGTNANGSVGTSANHPISTNANHPVGSSANASVGTNANPHIAKGTKGTNGSPPGRQADLKNPNGKAVRFVNEIMAQIAAIDKRIADARRNTANLKKTLAPDVAEAIKWLESETERLKTSKKAEDKKTVSRYVEEIESRKKNPQNWISGKLLPGPAAEVANLTMRKQELERQLAFLE